MDRCVYCGVEVEYIAAVLMHKESPGNHYLHCDFPSHEGPKADVEKPQVAI